MPFSVFLWFQDGHRDLEDTLSIGGQHVLFLRIVWLVGGLKEIGLALRVVPVHPGRDRGIDLVIELVQDLHGVQPCGEAPGAERCRLVTQAGGEKRGQVHHFLAFDLIGVGGLHRVGGHVGHRAPVLVRPDQVTMQVGSKLTVLGGPEGLDTAIVHDHFRRQQVGRPRAIFREQCAQLIRDARGDRREALVRRDFPAL